MPNNYVNEKDHALTRAGKQYQQAEKAKGAVNWRYKTGMVS
jgi:hypothetical protein